MLLSGLMESPRAPRRSDSLRAKTNPLKPNEGLNGPPVLTSYSPQITIRKTKQQNVETPGHDCLAAASVSRAAQGGLERKLGLSPRGSTKLPVTVHSWVAHSSLLLA